MAPDPESASLTEAKQAAYYSACVEAWIDTRMEKDRSLLALSAGGIGLLTTLLTAVGVKSAPHLLLYTLAALAFLVAIITALAIFERNSKRLERIVKGDYTEDLMLWTLDRILLGAFILGIVLTLLVGVCAAVSK